VLVQKKPITILTIIIFGIGIIAGLVILYDYLVSQHFLSKQKALEIAMQRSLCAENNTSQLRDVGIHLLHVKNDTLFSVDEKTMQDMSLVTSYHFKNNVNNEYVWEVTWECYFTISNQYGTQINFVDAITGKLLE
jgi:hypothetical protein